LRFDLRAREIEKGRRAKKEQEGGDVNDEKSWHLINIELCYLYFDTEVNYVLDLG
jgi:hypothetical protein